LPVEFAGEPARHYFPLRFKEMSYSLAGLLVRVLMGDRRRRKIENRNACSFFWTNTRISQILKRLRWPFSYD